MAIPYEIGGSGDDRNFIIPTHVRFGSIVRAIKSIPGSKIIAKHYWLSLITDDCYGRFSIDGYEFDFDTVLSDYYAIMPTRKGYPDEPFQKIRASLDVYQPGWKKLFNRIFRSDV